MVGKTSVTEKVTFLRVPCPSPPVRRLSTGLAYTVESCGQSCTCSFCVRIGSPSLPAPPLAGEVVTLCTSLTTNTNANEETGLRDSG